jgi:hypothetical protein
VIYPNGGENLNGAATTLRWTASDIDGDSLRYAVQYSRDAGATWQTLVSDLITTTYEWSLRNVPGTDQGLLRVLASDGYHTSSDASNATFRVAFRAPQVTIKTPLDDSLFVGDQAIVFEGTAVDAEDGQLQAAALTWRSSLNGDLGNGGSLTLSAAALMPGTHTITLTARDSGSLTASATVQIRVASTRPSLPIELAVSPTDIDISTLSGTGLTPWQPLSIRNVGDGTATWSASADQSWVRLSSLAGTAPTDILIAADITGLAAGEYHANIRVSAPGAVNSPQTVQMGLRIIPASRAALLPMIVVGAP